jgi:hypothetical protein
MKKKRKKKSKSSEGSSVFIGSMWGSQSLTAHRLKVERQNNLEPQRREGKEIVGLSHFGRCAEK